MEMDVGKLHPLDELFCLCRINVTQRADLVTGCQNGGYVIGGDLTASDYGNSKGFVHDSPN